MRKIRQNNRHSLYFVLLFNQTGFENSVPFVGFSFYNQVVEHENLNKNSIFIKEFTSIPTKGFQFRIGFCPQSSSLFGTLTRWKGDAVPQTNDIVTE